MITGAMLGFSGVFLVVLGNPVNSGICVSCFMENVAGALQLHDNIRMSYIRPEFVGFILGSFLLALRTGRFRPVGGSAPVTRFFVGFFIIVGCAVFIGCPIKMYLRLAAGDLTAVAATAGLILGIWIGVKYIKMGYAMEPAKQVQKAKGYVFPLFAAVLLLLLFLDTSFVVKGDKGPAAMRAPLWAALIIGLTVGALAQRSGLCVTGAIRNFLLAREKTLLNGLLTSFGVALAASLAFGQFKLGINAQPASHLSHGWTFLAMTLVGFASVLIDGCPFRQLIKAGQGDTDAAVASLGMLTGGALVYVWLIGSSSAGPTLPGKIAVLLGFAVSLAVAFSFRRKRRTT
jgi:hypothetical protein